MMIPYGYKQTEVGVIPEDWKCTTAKQLMKIETGSRNTENKTNAGIYPFFVRSQKIESIDTYHYNCEAVLTAGDGVGTGKVFHYYIGKFDAHQRVYVMSGFNGISGRYFYYYFSENFEKEVSKYTAKSSVDSVRHDMIAEMKIPLPPLPEQQRIAEALSDVDGMISSLEKLIAKYKSIKTACLQQMFPQNGETVPRMRLPGFTGAWEQRKFDEVFDCTVPNNTLSRAELSYDEGTVLNVHYGDVLIKYGSVLDVQKDDIPRIPHRCREDFNEALLQDGDVIIADTAEDETTGKACEIGNLQGSAIVSGLHTMVCRPRNRMALGYLGYYLNSNAYHHQLLPLMQGIKVLSLSRSNIQKTSVSYPIAVKEQQLIAYYFSQLDNLITLHQRKLEKIQKIKQGMMQQLLTGKIRLV